MNLKKIIFLTLLVVILVLVGIFLFKNEEVDESKLSLNSKEEVDLYADYEEYKKSDWGFEVKYPKDWEQKKIDENGENLSIAFFSPKEDNLDVFIENVIVFASKAEGQDFDELMGEGIKEMAEDPVKELIENRKTSISGYPAYVLEYLVTDYATKSKYLHYFINAGERWYQILYTARIDTYDDHFKTVEKIINSMVIK